MNRESGCKNVLLAEYGQLGAACQIKWTGCSHYVITDCYVQINQKLEKNFIKCRRTTWHEMHVSIWQLFVYNNYVVALAVSAEDEEPDMVLNC